MWNSNQYPPLTDEEMEQAILDARKKKGQELYRSAYAKKTTGIREFPSFNAKSFKQFVMKRGDARALDRHWKAGKFDLDADNKSVFNILCLYFTRDERFEGLKPEYSLHKGIYLAGPRGVGKSELMRLCSVNPHACYSQHDCQDIADEYTQKDSGGVQVINQYSNNTYAENTDNSFGQDIIGRFFDDLGQETIGKHMGNERNVMESIIEKRYKVGAYYLTHFTSNHTIEEVNGLYGGRVQDRLREMCNIIEYPSTAKSRR